MKLNLSIQLVAGYYLGNGGGTATKLKWKGLGLDTLEHIDIEVINKSGKVSFKLFSVNYISKKKTVRTLDIMDLPKEYSYMDYQPIIKKSNL